MVYRRQGASGVRLCSIAWYHQGPQAGCQAVCKGAAAAADSSSAASLLIYDKLVDQQCMHIHKMLDLLQRRYKAPTSAPAPKPNSRSDSSSDSSDSFSDSGCSADEQESARKKQASEPATLASRAAEFWVLLESKGGSFRCPEWMLAGFWAQLESKG
eukprot:1137172-Pelagomonas_calceolata.AAC.4